MQNNLCWNTHLESGDKALLPGVRSQLGHLRHLGGLIPIPSRINLANGLLISRLNYLMPLWGEAPPSQINKIQIVMNSIARWATGLPKRTKISKLLEKTGWFSIREAIRISTIIQIWKIIHYGKPQRLLERMTVNEELDISVKAPRLVMSRNCFRWRGPRDWNALPRDLREINTLGTFKRKLKRHIRDLRTAPD